MAHTGYRSARHLEPVLDAVDNIAVVVESIDNANVHTRLASDCDSELGAEGGKLRRCDRLCHDVREHILCCTVL